MKGVLPVKPKTTWWGESKDYDFHGSFGTTTLFPDTLNTDAGLTNPNQNAEGYPEGCTWYAQNELCIDSDKAVYDVKVVRQNTLNIGNQTDGPCEMRDALASVILFGAGQMDDPASWSRNRRGAFYRVDVGTGMDAFDLTRSAMTKYQALWGKPCSVSVCSRWYPEFNYPRDGILPTPTSPTYSEHNWKVCGWKQINGVPFLIVKAWEGPTWADNGFAYISREIYNQLLNDYFSAAYVLAPFTGDYTTIRLDYLEFMIGILARFKVKGAALITATRLIESAAATLV